VEIAGSGGRIKGLVHVLTMEHARRWDGIRKKYTTSGSTTSSNAQLHIQRPPERAKESTVRVQDVSGGDTARGDIVKNKEQPDLAGLTSLLRWFCKLTSNQPLGDRRTL
jgi:hypothetical protein